MDRYGVYLQLYKRAPAPIRDYYGLTITDKEIILNIWNITHGPHTYPKRQKCPLEDFSVDRMFKSEVERLFGNHVVDYCQHLSTGQLKLQCLPTKIFLCILRHLATNDIIRLSQTSKIFFELFNRESTWKMLFGKLSKKRPTCDDMEDAKLRGWKNVLMTKVLLHGSKHTNTSTIKSAPKIIGSAKSALLNLGTPKASKVDYSQSNSFVNEMSVKQNLVPNDRKIQGATKKVAMTSNCTKVTIKEKNVVDINVNPFKVPQSYLELPKTNNLNIGNRVMPFTIQASRNVISRDVKTRSESNLNNKKVMNYSYTDLYKNNKINMESKCTFEFIDNIKTKDKNINGTCEISKQMMQKRKGEMKNNSSSKYTNHVKFK